MGRSARFAARRLGWALPLVLAVVTVDFALVHLAPGDPVTYLVGDPTLVTAEQLAQVRQDLQLDQPLWRQFLAYLNALLHGDLGFSILNRRPVLALVLERLPATLLLMAASLVLSLLAGLLLGFVSALKARSMADYALGLMSLLGYSMPPFLVRPRPHPRVRAEPGVVPDHGDDDARQGPRILAERRRRRLPSRPARRDPGDVLHGHLRAGRPDEPARRARAAVPGHRPGQGPRMEVRCT